MANFIKGITVGCLAPVILLVVLSSGGYLLPICQHKLTPCIAVASAFEYGIYRFTVRNRHVCLFSLVISAPLCLYIAFLCSL
jgi:hypothetical protein